MRVSDDTIKKMNEYFMALNYLSVGQLYLLDNPLLKRPLEPSDIKKKIIGHWGTAPGQNFIYLHLNRIIKQYNLNMIYIAGPGHGGQFFLSNAYLEGTYSSVYKEITQDEEGLKKLMRQFSFPKGVSSHVAPDVPGSINEGGELGYSLAHAFGAAFDNKDLIVACVIGDGEAETGPLAASWHCNKLLNPSKDGTVLPILHLNGYKIANPTAFGRMSNQELISYFSSLGYKPYIVSGKDYSIHRLMINTLDKIVKDIQKIKKENSSNIKWPMLILKTPKGWTGPKVVEGLAVENSFRSHQIPLTFASFAKDTPLLEKWLRSYHPELIFDENGRLRSDLKELAPSGDARMSANPIANGGLLLKDLNLPDFRNYAVTFEKPGTIKKEDMRVLGTFIRDIIKNNPDNYKVFGPDEALSNRLNAVFEVTGRKWNGKTFKSDEFLSPTGQVVDSLLSEHICEGLLEGYLLTGRHGFFHTYEAFVRIVDSMASQHAKWLKVAKEVPWRKPISSLNYILTSHIWQQDHNGYTHQDPGFLNHLVTKKADIVRIYLPFDANTLLSCYDHVARTKNYINVIVASKHPSLQWLNMEEATKHCAKGIGILEFASSKGNPDVVLGCCGDTPTLEVLAATKILKQFLPKLKVRVVNVVDLMRLQTDLEHPHGLTQKEYNSLFTTSKPIIFAFHGYPNLIHQLTYKRENKNLHVHGYLEEGTITTPFDMRVQNKIDRYHLVLDVLKYIKPSCPSLEEYCHQMLEKHEQYIQEHGIDMEEVRDFTWTD